MSTDLTSVQPTRSERLDRLPFTRKHARLLGGSGVGWALDAMDVGMISFVLAALVQQWGISSGEVSLLASIGFVGMAIGASLGGLLADRLGRRQVFALTLLVYGVATGAAALSVGLGMLIALRFVVGLGLGAELPVASTLVSEYAPKAIRGRVVVALEAFWAIGWVLAALVGYFVIPGSDNGWRWALAIGAVPAAYAVFVRWRLPESVRFLERRGRHAEAEAAVRGFEEAAGIPGPGSGEAGALRQAQDVGSAQGVGEGGAVGSGGERPELVEGRVATPKPSIWSGALRRRTTALWVVWFCVNLSYYGAFLWLPTLLVADGYSLLKSFQYTLIITLAQLPGYAVSAWLIEAWGRRSTLATFLVGSAVSAVLFGTADSVTLIIVFGMMLSFFNLGAWGALYAVGPEIYPTAVRTTGAGAAAGFGRIASILAPFLVPWLVGLGGNPAVFITFGASFALAAGAALLLPERRGRALTE